MRNLFNMDKSLSNSDLNSFGKIKRKKIVLKQQT